MIDNFQLQPYPLWAVHVPHEYAKGQFGQAVTCRVVAWTNRSPGQLAPVITAPGARARTVDAHDEVAYFDSEEDANNHHLVVAEEARRRVEQEGQAPA